MCDKIPQKLYDLLREAINDDVTNYTLSVGDANKKGEGFLADMCFVSLKHKQDENIMYNFAIKQAFEDDKTRNVHPIRNYFLNEIYFYDTVWPALKKLQKEVLLWNIFDKIPKCFTTSSQDKGETLVLDNVKCQNFNLVDKRVAMNTKHFEFIFKEYGRFHALSYAYREMNLRQFLELSNKLQNPLIDVAKGKGFNDYVRSIHETCMDYLNPVDDAKAIEKYRNYVERGGEIFLNTISQTDADGRFVILHGDCWSNNMMFKYDESGKPIDFRLLDFQLSYPGNPVSDLSYCLYAGGSKETFDKLDYFLEVYHNSLKETLAKVGCKPENVFTLEELKKDWKKYCRIGFTMGLMLWRMKLVEEGGARNLSEMDEKNDMMKVNYDEEYFRKTSKELIQHMYENDFL